MGNPKSGQTAHRFPSSNDHAEGAGLAGQAQFSRPPISIEPECASGLIASLCTKATVPTPDSVQSDAEVTPFAPDDDSDAFYDALGSDDHRQQNQYPSNSEVELAPTQPSLDTTIVDDDAFYDAPTMLEDEVVQIPTAQVSSELEGSSKCVTSSSVGRGCSSRVCISEPPGTTIPSTPTPPATSTQGRGASSSVAASPNIGAPPILEPHAPRRKGLLMGMNYLRSDRPLKYGVQDAAGLGLVLGDMLGFSGEDLVLVVDGKRPKSASLPAVGLGSKPSRGGRNQPLSGESQWERPVYFDNKKQIVYPTRRNMIKGFQWLICGAREGDRLVWLFSGHCGYIHGEGPYLVTADIKNTGDFTPSDAISKADILEELVLKVPRGCRLDIFLDCCYGSALLDLQYCVGLMLPREARVSIQATQPLPIHITPKPNQIPAPAVIAADVKQALTSEHRRGNIHASLYGSGQVPHAEDLLEGVPEPTPAPAVQAWEPTPTSVAHDPLPSAQPITGAASLPPRKMTKRTNGIAAASSPAPAPPSPQAPSWIPNWMRAATNTTPEPQSEGIEVKHSTSTQVKHTRHGVIEAPRLPDSIMRRMGRFDQPEGYVMMWAAAGRFEPAFEASEPAQHGILTNVLCEALGTDREITAQELWTCIRDALGLENERRGQRDQCKDEKDRKDPRARVQHAELWVSHPETEISIEMGKATVVQTTRLHVPLEAANLRVTRFSEEVPVVGQTTLTEPEPTSVLTVSLQARLSSSAPTPRQPQDVAIPLTSNEDGGTFYDAPGPPVRELPTSRLHIEHVGKAQRGSASAVFDATTIDGGDVLCDAPATGEDSIVATSVQRTSRGTSLELLSKSSVNSRPIRGRHLPTSSALLYDTATPSTHGPSMPRGRRPSSVAASPTTDPTPVPSSNLSRRKALLIGMCYSKSKWPLKYAAQDAIQFGQNLATRFGIRDQDLVFIVDEPVRDHMPSRGVGAGHKQNRAANSNRNQLSPHGSPWQKPTWFDGERQYVYPTRDNIITGFRWLINDAKKGDHLTWYVSGHCGFVSHEGPYLIPANIKKDGDAKIENMISKQDILNELLAKVPKGCHLDIFVDTCYSSALFNLQYCVVHMRQTETQISITGPQPLSKRVTSKPSQAPAPVAVSADIKPPLLHTHEHKNTHGSLHGSRPIAQTAQNPESIDEITAPVSFPTVQAQEPASTAHVQDSLPPVELSTTTTLSPPWKMKSQGVTAATGPVLEPPALASTSWIPSIPAWMQAETVTAPGPIDRSTEARRFTSSQVRYARDSVISAPRPPNFFEKKREVGFDQLEGHVTVWSATGEHQSAFEASEPARHGIFTNVLCQALKTYKEITNRELWGRLRKALEFENKERERRDQQKNEDERPDPRKRVQYAELWTSRPQDFATLFLEEQAFCSVLAADSQPKAIATAAT